MDWYASSVLPHIRCGGSHHLSKLYRARSFLLNIHMAIFRQDMFYNHRFSWETAYCTCIFHRHSNVGTSLVSVALSHQCYGPNLDNIGFTSNELLQLGFGN